MTRCKDTVLTTEPRIFIIHAYTAEVWPLFKFLNIKEEGNRKGTEWFLQLQKGKELGKSYTLWK